MHLLLIHLSQVECWMHFERGIGREVDLRVILMTHKRRRNSPKWRIEFSSNMVHNQSQYYYSAPDP